MAQVVLLGDSILDNAAYVRGGPDVVRQLRSKLPAAFCTICDAPPSAPDHRIVRTALALFNDVITRTAFASGAGLIDLRLICGRDEDYANPIEPSVRGGDEIASAIAAWASRGNPSDYGTVLTLRDTEYA